MEVFKIFVFLFSIRLSHSALSKPNSMCHGNLPPAKYVALNSNVTVACPKLSGIEVDFKLYKGSDKVTSIYININNTNDNKYNDNKRDLPAHLSINFTDNSVNFILFGVTLNITALYTCEAVRFFPPPSVNVEQTPQTIVFVKDNPRKQLCQHVSCLNLWVVFGVMIIYGLIMSCMVLILSIKLSQIDFKKTKVREGRQRWQGVQHPTLQGFYIDTEA